MSTIAFVRHISHSWHFTCHQCSHMRKHYFSIFPLFCVLFFHLPLPLIAVSSLTLNRIGASFFPTARSVFEEQSSVEQRNRELDEYSTSRDKDEGALFCLILFTFTRFFIFHISPVLLLFHFLSLSVALFLAWVFYYSFHIQLVPSFYFSIIPCALALLTPVDTLIDIYLRFTGERRERERERGNSFFSIIVVSHEYSLHCPLHHIASWMFHVFLLQHKSRYLFSPLVFSFFLIWQKW